MVIDLRKCADQPLHLERRFDVAALFADIDDLEGLNDVGLVLDVTPAGAGKFLVRGNFSGQARATCGRCLEPVPITLEGQFRLTYLPESMRRDDDGAEMSENSAELAYYANDSLEVLQLLEEQVAISLPMRFLCKSDCLGLCAQCGTNRNQQNCNCPEPTSTSPLESLRQLLH